MGGGYSMPTVPAPKLKVELDRTVRENPRINCIMEKLSVSEFARSIAPFVKSGSSQTNTVIKLKPLQGDRNGQTQLLGGFYEITINSNMIQERSDLLIARTVLYELVHAELYATLATKSKVPPLDMDFAENFNEFVNVYYGTKVASHDLQHRYMAENLLNTMGKALMDIHKNQFNADYQSLNREMKKNGDYPNGVTVEFYKNLFWGGFNKTFAYAQMKAIKAYPLSYLPLKNLIET